MKLNNICRRSLAISTIVYFGSALIIGLPLMFFFHGVFAGIFNLFQINWFVTSSTGVIIVAAAFLLGIWVSEKVSEWVIYKVS